MTEPCGPVIWDRITVRRLPDNSFIGEARLHARFAVGAICKNPADALASADEAMLREMTPITRVKQARVISTPDDEELL